MGNRKVNKLFTDVMQGNIIESSEDFNSILLNKINWELEEKHKRNGNKKLLLGKHKNNDDDEDDDEDAEGKGSKRFGAKKFGEGKIPPQFLKKNGKKNGKKKDDDDDDDDNLDPVDKSELKGKHADRDDKDIDNDGDVDDSDKFLHKKRKAISKAMKKESRCLPCEAKQRLMREMQMNEAGGMSGTNVANRRGAGQFRTGGGSPGPRAPRPSGAGGSRRRKLKYAKNVQHHAAGANEIGKVQVPSTLSGINVPPGTFKPQNGGGNRNSNNPYGKSRITPRIPQLPQQWRPDPQNGGPGGGRGPGGR